MITQTINLNMVPGAVYPVIHVNQYDNDSGALIFKLFNGSAFSIPSGSSVVINGTKPDGYGFSYSASYSGNTVTADVTQQMTAVAGEVKCELRITNGNNIIGTQNFTLMVEPAALDENTVISDSDIPAIAAAADYAAEAAASAAEAAATVSGKVSKAGDTMTGNLLITDNKSIYIYGSDPSIDTTPSNYYWGNGVYLRDANAATFGNIASFHSTLGERGIYIQSRAGVDNKLTLGAIGTTPYVGLSHPAAWRDPLMTPTRVSSGSIDDITTPGYYYLVQGSVSDLPEGTNGDVLVFNTLGDGTINCWQVFRRAGTIGVNDGNLYMRSKNATAWGRWWKYGDSTQYLNVSNSVSVSSINCSGLITSSQKNMAFFVPYPVVGTSFTINNLGVIVRYPDFTSGAGIYPYVRSGTNGGTYTQLGYSNTSLYTNGAATRTNEINSVSISVQPGVGIQFSISFVYAICRESGNTTAVDNNLPATIQVTLTGTTS